VDGAALQHFGGFHDSGDGGKKQVLRCAQDDKLKFGDDIANLLRKQLWK
jgi:hypothetical protein